MPPIQLNKKLSGHRKSECFPSQLALARKAKARLNRTGRSQLEVWGAAITTSLSTSGNRPSNRHPKTFRKEKARARIKGLITGVSKSVYRIDQINSLLKPALKSAEPLECGDLGPLW